MPRTLIRQHARWSMWGLSTNQWVHHDCVKPLIQKRVPAKIVDNVWRGLEGPPDPVILTQDRYFSASACQAHNCDLKGFFWIDAHKGIGLGAFLIPVISWSGTQQRIDTYLHMGSNGFSAQTIPAAARKAVLDWMTEQQVRPDAVEFVDRAGGSVLLDAGMFQPCPDLFHELGVRVSTAARTSSTIEEIICTDAGLSGFDLEMTDLFERIRHGTSTVPYRTELRDVQRAWLKTRDADCAHSTEMRQCLKASYLSQIDRLQHWVPTASGPRELAH